MIVSRWDLVDQVRQYGQWKGFYFFGSLVSVRNFRDSFFYFGS